MQLKCRVYVDSLARNCLWTNVIVHGGPRVFRVLMHDRDLIILAMTP